MAEMAFDGQREGEEVELVFRRHFLTTWRGFVVLILLVGLGYIPMLVRPGERVWFFVWLGCLAIGLLFALSVYMKWYFSYYLVTNERIRQVRQRGIFRKTVVDLGLDKIQSIKYDVPGIWAGILGYGTLLIRTQVGNMTISMVQKPEKIYNILQDLASKAAK